jgi:hypothetical protein
MIFETLFDFKFLHSAPSKLAAYISHNEPQLTRQENKGKIYVNNIGKKFRFADPH